MWLFWRLLVSSPTRGTWIERFFFLILLLLNIVVPHAGDVDRKTAVMQSVATACVVPHAGDVDRKEKRGRLWHAAPVVPHAGDVDRKIGQRIQQRGCHSRPPRGGRG